MGEKSQYWTLCDNTNIKQLGDTTMIIGPKPTKKTEAEVTEATRIWRAVEEKARRSEEERIATANERRAALDAKVPQEVKTLGKRWSSPDGKKLRYYVSYWTLGLSQRAGKRGAACTCAYYDPDQGAFVIEAPNWIRDEVREALRQKAPDAPIYVP